MKLKDHAMRGLFRCDIDSKPELIFDLILARESTNADP